MEGGLDEDIASLVRSGANVISSSALVYNRNDQHTIVNDITSWQRTVIRSLPIKINPVSVVIVYVATHFHFATIGDPEIVL